MVSCVSVVVYSDMLNGRARPYWVSLSPTLDRAVGRDNRRAYVLVRVGTETDEGPSEDGDEEGGVEEDKTVGVVGGMVIVVVVEVVVVVLMVIG